MDYDVLILGGELVGCAIAYELSKYNLNIALVERNYDIADEISLSNTAIVFNGMENSDKSTAELEALGNAELQGISKKFNIPYAKISTLIVNENEKYIDDLYKNMDNKDTDLCEIINKEEILRIEPRLKDTKFSKAIHLKNTGMISPYDLAISYGEVAFENNVNFKLEEEVIDIIRDNKGYKVNTNKNKFTCKIVINTTQRHNYSIDNHNDIEKTSSDAKIKFFLTQKDIGFNYSNVIVKLKANNECSVVLPSLNNEILGAIVTKDISMINLSVLEKVNEFLPKIENNNIKSFYESNYYDKPYSIIEENDCGYIQVSDKHYAIATMIPVISKKVVEYVSKSIHCIPKKEFTDKRREFYRFRELSDEKRNEIIKVNPKYGNVICNCSMVTEGEIEDAIRRPLGARTLEGVKHRTGAALGKCDGSRCLNKILKILARETNKPLISIVKDSKKSNVLLNRIKEFDTM